MSAMGENMEHEEMGPQAWIKKKKLFMRDAERQRHGQREKPIPHGEPDVGLHPRTPGIMP